MKDFIAWLKEPKNLFLAAFVSVVVIAGLSQCVQAAPDGERTVISKSNYAWGFLIEGQEYPWVCGRLVDDMTSVRCVSQSIGYQCEYVDPPIYFQNCVKDEETPNNAIIPAE